MLRQMHSCSTVVLVVAALLVPMASSRSSGSRHSLPGEAGQRHMSLRELVSRYEPLHLRPRVRRSGGSGAVHMTFDAFDR